jgi:hypothetical protein
VFVKSSALTTRPQLVALLNDVNFEIQMSLIFPAYHNSKNKTINCISWIIFSLFIIFCTIFKSYEKTVYHNFSIFVESTDHSLSQIIFDWRYHSKELVAGQTIWKILLDAIPTE